MGYVSNNMVTGFGTWKNEKKNNLDSLMDFHHHFPYILLIIITWGILGVCPIFKRTEQTLITLQTFEGNYEYHVPNILQIPTIVACYVFCFLLPWKYHVSRFTTWVGLHSLLKLSLQPTGGICVFKMCKNSWMQFINKHWHMVQVPVQQSYLYPLDWQFPKLLGSKYKVSPPKQ